MSLPRPFALTLADRSFTYQPNPVAGNKPVTIGHAYSVVAFLPEKRHPDDPPWVLPLLTRRVQSTEKAIVVGAEQLEMLLDDEQQPFHDRVCVHVADSAYSAVEYQGRVTHRPNLVSITRTPENRMFYRQSPARLESRGPGYPQWYGERFDLKDNTTWGTPDEMAETTFTTRCRRAYRVILQSWHNLLMRGKRDLPMHRHPFTLIRATVLDEQGQPVFKRALWLIVLGERRGRFPW